MSIKSALKQIYATYALGWNAITSRYPLGTNVYDKEWDVLVILDACRVDALQAVSNEYDFVSEIEEIWSIGSTSKEWIEQTFDSRYIDEIQNTAYITGNPFSNVLLDERERLEYIATLDTWVESSSLAEKLVSDNVVDIDDVGHMEALWGSAESGAGFHDCQKPDSVTEYTIKAARCGDYDRVIAHYMQPHHPYFSSSTNPDELTEIEKNPFAAIKDGRRDEVWDAYLDNLRYGLDWVEKLIQNVDGRVVITSDHGELMGEQKMHFHMVGNPHPTLKKVPWVEVNATDTSSIQPDVAFNRPEEAQEISQDQLEALGYL